MLQEPLDEGDVKAVILVNLRGVPFAEAVGADALVAQTVTDDGELLLNCSCGHREDQVVAAYVVAQTIVFDVLLDDQRDSEDALLACLLLVVGLCLLAYRMKKAFPMKLEASRKRLLNRAS